MINFVKPALLVTLLCGLGTAAAQTSNVAAKPIQADPTAKASVTKVDAKEPEEEFLPPAVNPMTGKALTYEEKERMLREKTLDARLADQAVMIAKSKVELKKVLADGKGTGRDAPVKASALPDAVRAYGDQVAPKKPAAVAKSARSRTSQKQPVQTALPSNPIQLEPVRPSLVGVMESGGKQIAMFNYGGRIHSVAEGDAFSGGRVTKVSGDTAVLNGVQYAVAKGTSVIDLPETRKPAVPGSLNPAPQPFPTQRGAVSVPGVNAAASQPLAAGTPIGGSGTEPVRFPNDLYKR